MIKFLQCINGLNISNNRYIRDYLPYLSLLWLLVFIKPDLYLPFWQFGFFLLILIVFSRPLSDVLPKLSILRQIVAIRKQIGILCWSFILAHWVWFFINMKMDIFSFIWNTWFWSLNNWLLWGILWIFICIVLSFTSNIWSMKFLWKYWKVIHRFTYLFFIFWALHIAFLKPDKQFFMIFLVVLWSVLWILAYKKIVLWE